MDLVIKWLDKFYESMRFATRDMTIFPGLNLYSSLKINFILLVLNSICYILNIYVFINPVHCLVSFIVLLMLVLLSSVNKKKEVNKDEIPRDV